MTNNSFKITKKDSKTNARLGVLKTQHGTVKTPSYVIVATHAAIRYLSPSDIKKTKTQIMIANTYHLWDRVLAEKDKKDWVHKKIKLKIPIMTDSGGFQVFSLGFGHQNKVGKILSAEANKIKNIKRQNIKITEKGVWFSIDGRKRFLNPEISIKVQDKIGADMIFAFDECTSPLDGPRYNKDAMARTHRWLKRSIKAKTNKNQMLFGIIQGGKYKNLRIESTKFIASQPVDAIGIGGSFGKDEMAKTLSWIHPYLPEEKPRHLLGVGKIKDIFNAVENGMDLFDCVIPTREARHGRIYTRKGTIDIRRGYFSKDKKIIEKNCGCPTCKAGISRAEIRWLLKCEDFKYKGAGQRWCLMHNIWFFNNLLEEIRDSLQKDKYQKFKEKFLKSFEK